MQLGGVIPTESCTAESPENSILGSSDYHKPRIETNEQTLALWNHQSRRRIHLSSDLASVSWLERPRSCLGRVRPALQ
jgi:hypothetical protein